MNISNVNKYLKIYNYKSKLNKLKRDKNINNNTYQLLDYNYIPYDEEVNFTHNKIYVS